MAKLWITYAWKDNQDNDVDFVVQQLRNVGLHVDIDRFSLGAGNRLWEQIGEKISNPNQSDAWAIFATLNSISSEPCKEELAIALDRALHARGDSFPLIGIFPAGITSDLIPPAIRTRLYVSLSDPDWIERVKAAVESRAAAVTPPVVSPIHHRVLTSGRQTIVEARPRTGRWYPSFVVVRAGEADRLDTALVAPSGALPGGANDRNQQLSNRRRIQGDQTEP